MKNKKRAAKIFAAAAISGIALSGCGNTIDSDAVFATLDDTVITMGVANFSAKYQQANYDSFYTSYFGEDMWEKDLYGNGNTLAQDVKNDVAENLENMYLLKAHMEDYKVELSTEEEEAIEKAADTFLSDNSQEALKQVGGENREDVLEVLRLYTIQSKMRKSIEESADVEVTEEEAAQRSFSYVVISTTGRYDEESNLIEYTEEEKADLRKDAVNIAEAEDFEKAVTDAGYSVSKESYGSAEDSDSSMSKEVLEAADNLKEGDISGVVETDNGYYVLRLDSENDAKATAEKKEELLSQKKSDYYEDVLSGWRDEAKWEINEKEWEKVTFKDRFTAKADPADTQAPAEEEGLSATEGVELK
ncbi:MAG: peptidyl-prolyl cis-trans isomerase [Lachnospiraceae bacterium]|nr:peptidyl-prolyl cis-trans isomerase [Lachnospiraceae bacterium]MDE6981470.1 peptidyl-prolyl cis-trans isomerase [Lachnospiraceae bacterium]